MFENVIIHLKVGAQKKTIIYIITCGQKRTQWAGPTREGTCRVHHKVLEGLGQGQAAHSLLQLGHNIHFVILFNKISVVFPLLKISA